MGINPEECRTEPNHGLIDPGTYRPSLFWEFGEDFRIGEEPPAGGTVHFALLALICSKSSAARFSAANNSTVVSLDFALRTCSLARSLPCFAAIEHQA